MYLLSLFFSGIFKKFTICSNFVVRQIFLGILPPIPTTGNVPVHTGKVKLAISSLLPNTTPCCHMVEETVDHLQIVGDFKHGSIKRIKLVNFLTYAYVEFNAGPRYASAA